MMTDTPAVAAPATSTWETNADFWIKIIREQRDRYRSELTDGRVLAAAGDVTGLDVLDAGCGEGYMSRELASRGALVHGVDRSAALIAAAKDTAPPGVLFSQQDVACLPFPDRSYDLVVANHLLNDLPDIDEPVRELARVLRPGGRLVALMLHPVFYGHRAETASLAELPAVAEYFAARPVTQAFKVDGLVSPEPSTSWIRPLEAYTTALADAGLLIAGLSEPRPSAGLVASSRWWRENFPRPLFMLIAARKNS